MSDCNTNYRPVLSSDRAPYMNKLVIVGEKKKVHLKSVMGPKRGRANTKTNWPTDRLP
jgi:hypothetical protein